MGRASRLNEEKRKHGDLPLVEGFVPLGKREDQDRIPWPEKIVVGYAHGAMVHEVFSRSLAKMLRADRNVVSLVHEASCNLPLNRNVILHRFLDEPEGDWLLFLDTDISFPVHTATTLLRVAQDTGADMVAVPYVLTNGCSTFAKALPDGGYYTQGSFKVDHAYYFDAAGTGCLMTSRSLLLRMKEAYAEQYAPWEFMGYDRIVLDGKPTYESEDYSFSRRAKQIGGRLVGYTAIVLGHSKQELLSFQGLGDMVTR